MLIIIIILSDAADIPCLSLHEKKCILILTQVQLDSTEKVDKYNLIIYYINENFTLFIGCIYSIRSVVTDTYTQTLAYTVEPLIDNGHSE